MFAADAEMDTFLPCVVFVNSSQIDGRRKKDGKTEGGMKLENMLCMLKKYKIIMKGEEKKCIKIDKRKRLERQKREKRSGKKSSRKVPSFRFFRCCYLALMALRKCEMK